MRFLMWLNHVSFSPPIILLQVLVQKHISKKVFCSLSLEDWFFLYFKAIIPTVIIPIW